MREIENLRKTRASLESMRQATSRIFEEIRNAATNYSTLNDELKETEDILKGIDEEEKSTEI